MNNLILKSFLASALITGIVGCGPKPTRERIGGSSKKLSEPAAPGSQLTKADVSKIQSLFNKEAIIQLQLKLAAEGLLSKPEAAERVAKEMFKDLISLSTKTTNTIDNLDNRLNDDDKNNVNAKENKKISQKPQNPLWDDLKIIEIRAEQDSGRFENLTMRIGLKEQEIELNGNFRTKNWANASWDDGRTVLLTDSSGSGSNIESLSSCISDDCKVILSLLRLDEVTFKVIVSSAKKLKQIDNMGSTTKKLVEGAADIHKIVGTDQQQMVFYIKLEQTNSKIDKIYSAVSVQDVMDISEGDFYINSPLEKTKVSIATNSGSKIAKIYYNVNNDSDDLYLEILD